jgi:hypothetical protein
MDWAQLSQAGNGFARARVCIMGLYFPRIHHDSVLKYRYFYEEMWETQSDRDWWVIMGTGGHHRS